MTRVQQPCGRCMYSSRRESFGRRYSFPLRRHSWGGCMTNRRAWSFVVRSMFICPRVGAAPSSSHRRKPLAMSRVTGSLFYHETEERGGGEGGGQRNEQRAGWRHSTYMASGMVARDCIGEHLVFLLICGCRRRAWGSLEVEGGTIKSMSRFRGSSPMGDVKGGDLSEAGL